MNEDNLSSGGTRPVFDGQEPETDGGGTGGQPRQEEYAGQAYRQDIYQESAPVTSGEYRQQANGQAGFGANQDPNGPKADPFGQNMAAGAGTYGQQAPQAPSKGFGIASLVLGIISLILFCSCVNIILAAVAIVFGILQLAQKDAPKGMAIAGIVTSCFSIILFIIAFVTFIVTTDFQEVMEHGYGYDQNLEDYFFGNGYAPQFDDDGNMYFPDSDDEYEDRDDRDYDDDEDDTF